MKYYNKLEPCYRYIFKTFVGRIETIYDDLISPQLQEFISLFTHKVM